MTISIQRLSSVSELDSIADEWDALLEASVYSSLYLRHEYMTSAIRAFAEADDLLILLARAPADERLIAIFPFKRRLLQKGVFTLYVLEYATTQEIDKPYPLIKRGWEETAWKAFARYLLSMPVRWDFLDLLEMREDSPALDYLRQSFSGPRFMTRYGIPKESPLIALDRDWSKLWDEHKHMRKKLRLMQRDFGESLAFSVYEGEQSWDPCLEAYIELEQRSWKRGEVGISKNDQVADFYYDIFPKLAGRGVLYFGFLYGDERLIAGDIAYVKDKQVYFAHGSYDPAYSKYSPGLVCKSRFIEYFHGKGLEYGDYLAGYAGYMKNWAAASVRTRDVRISRLSAANLAYFALKTAKSTYLRIRGWAAPTAKRATPHHAPCAAVRHGCF